MKTIKRILDIDLPQGQSAFLWGPRKIGKSCYLKETFPESLYFDFLKTDLTLEFTKRPSLLREQILAKDENLLKFPIILDEVQKVPSILDEVHWLVENRRLSFILCGSSARKLKRGKANLLGGRAWRYEMFPMVTRELGEVDLLRALNHGMIPDHYLQENYQKSLRGYVRDYLKEEVFDEGLTRNIPAFARFFDAVGYSHGELINYSNIARDCGVDAKTVKEYFQILIDTLLGRMVEPFKRKQSRQIITKAPKFYLFDVGVAGSLMKRHVVEEKGELFGKALENLIFMELAAHSSYRDLHYRINFWRTKSGREVDFILDDGRVAVEIKGTGHVDNRDMRGLAAFIDEYSPQKALVVCNEKTERLHGGIRIYPWRKFLNDLWEGRII
ncbi:MAG: AAA family ATPase [Acidobacteria bacterium]|nr:AAA family ATPase [Acidobacteriota bacterium]MBU1338501.1 AAA family ATPase [Acidobacteriota bacterium]MBU1474176.1 AAA family ATPase [Acidobacteriota bacterium]MBU4495498.1 AAA family ATPase [Acidobacteriota bacterium]